MSKPEWGIKRSCHTCHTRFYDLHKTPIVCPKCESIFDPEAILKARKTKKILPKDEILLDLPLDELSDFTAKDDLLADAEELDDDASYDTVMDELDDTIEDRDI